MRIIFFNLLLFSFLYSCKTEDHPEKYNGKVIEKIKKEIVYTKDGLEIDLGTDSIKKVFYLIRHAEKDTQKIEPNLSDAGIKRASNLTSIMRQTFLDAVYSTFTTRTMATVDSITQYKGLSNQIYTVKNMKETFTEALKSTTVNKILIVGHSNTVSPLANFLLGRTHFHKNIDENVYDNFIIIVHKINGVKQIYELKY
ncbi:MAG: hypothetical protein RLZZ546_1512 [Bacteroidota bacterium]|jgi:phosphohistidine phosphatase SixA